MAPPSVVDWRAVPGAVCASVTPRPASRPEGRGRGRQNSTWNFGVNEMAVGRIPAIRSTR